MDKSREQFDAWFHDRYDSISMKPVERVLLSANQWASWQASRAAVEVELPEKCGHLNMVNGRVTPEAANYDEAIDDCAESIRAAGLKVKGE